MFTAITAWLKPYLVYVQLGLILAMLAGFGYAVDRVQAKIDASALATVKLADAQSITAATQKVAALQVKTADLAQAAVVADNTVQTKIVTRTITLTQKVPTYVSNSVPCISYGLVRVLDAAVLQTDPGALALPAGVTDDTCTTLTADDLAKSVVTNYGIAEQNAQQLNDLVDDVQAQDAAQDAAASLQ